MEYRRAGISDVDTLAELRIAFICEVQDIDDNTEKEILYENNRCYIMRSIEDGSFIAFIAVDEDRVVATSGLTLFLLPPNRKCIDGKTAYISNMYTIPAYRKKGIAEKLFSMIVDEAKRLGYKKLMLNATDMGRPLYEKFGFTDTKNDMVYYMK